MQRKYIQEVRGALRKACDNKDLATITVITTNKTLGIDNLLNLTLIYAVRSGNFFVVDSLLAQGARVDFCDKHGKNAFNYACDLQNLNIIVQLISAGALKTPLNKFTLRELYQYSLSNDAARTLLAMHKSEPMLHGLLKVFWGYVSNSNKTLIAPYLVNIQKNMFKLCLWAPDKARLRLPSIIPDVYQYNAALKKEELYMLGKEIFAKVEAWFANYIAGYKLHLLKLEHSLFRYSAKRVWLCTLASELAKDSVTKQDQIMRKQVLVMCRSFQVGYNKTSTQAIVYKVDSSRKLQLG